MKSIAIFGFAFLLILGCGKPTKSYPKLEMSTDEIVDALVQIYTINAANELNNTGIRDSMSLVYIEQVSEVTGKPLSVIRSDIEKLKLMPDSLFILQSIALDTMRSIYERNYFRTKALNN